MLSIPAIWKVSLKSTYKDPGGIVTMSDAGSSDMFVASFK